MFPVSKRWTQLSKRSSHDINIVETLWVCIDCGLSDPSLGAIPASSVQALWENMRLDEEGLTLSLDQNA